MIERIVLIKLNDDLATDAGRAEVAAHSRATLAALPGVKGISVGVPADEASRKSWDLSIVVRFERLEDVEPYLVHPEHRQYVDQYLAPRMAVIKAWNFDDGQG